MTEIKFRIWNGKRMDYLITFRGVAKIEFIPQIIERMNGDEPLMQYTNLKDKNGKEIYEGDIISHPALNTFSFGVLNARVVFEEGCFRCIVTGSMRPELHSFFHGDDRVFVIGNIYQNPELIK